MPEINDTAQFLEYLRDIQELTPEALEAISNLFSTVTVKKNKDLQSIGQTCRTIYFVHEGAARIYYYKEGKDITEYFAFQHDLIIRAESLFTEKPSHKAIRVLGACC
ncbi:MAG: hypothetical protein RLO17_24470 [Cyclobacteriaceae bacterium]|jgi:signal-transduction protein with cAMP-binding, CBS, and nucleotidyltransferase domain|tara:strand:+ start:272 stop:592 length:321 start_codon:yes stop_codon:yes gene_type:complete